MPNQKRVNVCTTIEHCTSIGRSALRYDIFFNSFAVVFVQAFIRLGDEIEFFILFE